jgi:hypothetical protein
LKDLDNAHVAFIISRRPLLFKYFQDRLEYFDEKNIKTILIRQPSFIKYFEDRLNKFENFDIMYILNNQPQLAPYFEKQGLIKESLKYPPLRTILKR